MADRLDLSLDELIKHNKGDYKIGRNISSERRRRREKGSGTGGSIQSRAARTAGSRGRNQNMMQSTALEGGSKIRVHGIVSSVTVGDLKELFGQG
jgi:hypothetical protein